MVDNSEVLLPITFIQELMITDVQEMRKKIPKEVDIRDLPQWFWSHLSDMNLWMQSSVCGIIVTQLCVLVSVWRPCTASFIRLWWPSMRTKTPNGGRTTTAPACQRTGPRSRCVRTFPLTNQGHKWLKLTSIGKRSEYIKYFEFWFLESGTFCCSRS